MSKMASLESPTMKTLIANTQELIALLSSDPELIAGTLLSTNFIQGDVLVKVFGDDTPTGQAAIMFEAVVNEIEKAPEKLFEFLGILTEHLSATKVVDSLYATYESEFTCRFCRVCV